MSSSPARRRRHSPAVYRRRRITLLVLVVLVVAGLWLLIAQPWRGSATSADPAGQLAQPLLPVVSSSPQPVADSASPTPGATTSATPGATAAASPAPTPTVSADPCDPGNVSVKAVTDAKSYAPGQFPQLSIQLTNNGSSDCTLDVGTKAQSFTITSGTDTWWRSTDCQTDASDLVVLLKAGQKVASAQPISWDRTRSSVATCQATDRPQAPAGGASYHLKVSIGGLSSGTDAIFQLD